MKLFIFLLVSFLTFTNNITAQNSDTTRTTNYRRIELKNDQSGAGMQTYKEKYAGKDLNEVKASLFPHKGGTGVWTELNPKVPRVDYIGIHFVNPDTGWAVGDLGALIKTTNGGETWKTIETNTTLPILKIRSYNGQVVIASGYDGLILRSTDGGETFQQIESGLGSEFDLWGLEIVNDTLGWACGATALLKTTDAGESWQTVNIRYTGVLWAVEFLTESYGFIAADGKVLRTIDGGEHWEIIQAGDDKSLYIIDIIDSLHIAAAGYGGTSYRGKNLYSSDGGYTWINGGPLTFEPVNDIKYVNRDTGYAVMYNTIARKTTNRGQEWTGIQAAGEWELQFFKEENIGYSAGTGLRIYKTENGYENWQRLIINDNFADVFFINEEKGFAISGVLSVFQGLYKTTDGGINWEGIPGPSGQDILFLDSLTGFIGSNVIYKTTDGGETWYIPNGGQGGAGRIFFVNETTGWAIRSKIIYKTTDRGENWFEQFTTSFGFFTGIHFADSLNGWASGTRPYKTTDGGNTWVQQTNTDIWLSDDVYFGNIDTGWIVKRTLNSSLLKTTDSGLSWNELPEIIGAFSFHFFPNQLRWIINGSHNYITEDGGLSFIDITNEVPSSFNSFSAPFDYLGYAAGSLGLILKYEDTTYVTAPVFTVSENTINFGKVEIGTTKTDSILISNTGSGSLEVTEIISSNQNFTFSPDTFILPKSEVTHLTIMFTPSDTSVQSGYIIITHNGSSSPDTITVEGKGDIVVGIKDEQKIPVEYKLDQNYPNPFNPETKINYIIPEETIVNISLFDVTGRKIEELVNEKKQPGFYTIEMKGDELSSGIYFYRLSTSSGFSAVKKLTIIK